METSGRPTEPAPLIRFDESPTDEISAAAQLVPRFGYEEAERIMLDALDGALPIEATVPVDEITSVDDGTPIGEVRRSHRSRAV
jgi:hypothetical protein